MNGTPPPTGTEGAAAAGDPSMEDILASIRRILSDDEAKPEEAAASPVAPAVAEIEEDDALVLEPSMMVSDTPAADPEPPAPAPAPAPLPVMAPVPPLATIVAPEAAAAAASSVENLVRTISTERSMMVTSMGPTIEDIVRQEIRPLLKAWLDVNLPPLVERLVRTEIERVVGRAAT
jgi:cell pole-organizing protein PopZ